MWQIPLMCTTLRCSGFSFFIALFLWGHSRHVKMLAPHVLNALYAWWLICAKHYRNGPGLRSHGCMCVYVCVCWSKAMCWLPVVFFKACDWQQQTSVWLKSNGHSVRQTGSAKVTAEDISLKSEYVLTAPVTSVEHNCTHIVYIRSP